MHHFSDLIRTRHEHAGEVCRGPVQWSTQQVSCPPIRAFMDDLMVTTPHVSGSRWILKGLEEMTTMCFKPENSRSLVLKKGRSPTSFTSYFLFRWPLLIYEVPISTIEGFEKRVSRYLWKWLGLSRSLSNITLYGQNNKLKLPISSLSEAFKALVGVVTHGRAGLGSGTTSRYNKAQGKDRRALVQQEVWASVEEELASRTVVMQQQGAWARWEHAVDRKVSRVELWKAEPHRIRFLIQAVYDVLPSPSNRYWMVLLTP
ncbi:hypothetical protein SRHO_G00026300 [Serrasalmus rhombeus]